MLYNRHSEGNDCLDESAGEIVCPLEALRRGIDTPEIRAAAAQMQKQQAEIRAASRQRSFGRARMHSDGSIEYVKKGHEPPPNMDGFRRDPGNAWKFLPLWPKCPQRIQTPLMKACGAMDVITVCNHEDCEHKQKEVSFATCSSCPLHL